MLLSYYCYYYIIIVDYGVADEREQGGGGLLLLKHQLSLYADADGVGHVEDVAQAARQHDPPADGDLPKDVVLGREDGLTRSVEVGEGGDHAVHDGGQDAQHKSAQRRQHDEAHHDGRIGENDQLLVEAIHGQNEEAQHCGGDQVHDRHTPDVVQAGEPGEDHHRAAVGAPHSMPPAGVHRAAKEALTEEENGAQGVQDGDAKDAHLADIT